MCCLLGAAFGTGLLTKMTDWRAPCPQWLAIRDSTELITGMLRQDENEEMGRELAEGKLHAVERQAALAKTFAEDLRKAFAEVEDHVHALDAENEDLQAQLFALRRQQQDRGFMRPDRGFQGEPVALAETRYAVLLSALLRHRLQPCGTRWPGAFTRGVDNPSFTQMATGSACSRRPWTTAGTTHGVA